ncbi:hypothetical protein BGX21_008348 [Mortierella sp. AD011]|nr:hypothetical protein BGX20_003942 [Mortierella sp. AD010]KAF9397918.1 hypothetical protein BGX21_008348 [Mortierella sp. AD011]
MTGSGYNYGPNSDSNTWKLTASPKPMYATPPPPMQPSQQLCAPLPCFPSSSQFTPTGVPVISPQPRARTLSFSDSQHDRTFSASSLPFAPPTIRPSSCNGIRRSTPVRSSTHPTTFSIPQEILDPNYKSPTFRIKSWDPPSERSSTLAPLLAEVPKMGSEKTSPLRREVLGRWTDAEARLETVTKSSFLRSSADQHEVGVVATTPKVAQHQKNTCEAAFPCSVSPTEKVSNTPFQFSFTSQRFRAAVEASIEKTTLVADMSSRSSVVAETSSRKDEMDQTLGGIATKNSILQSALSPELKAEKEVKESLSDSTTTLIARVEEVDVVKIDTSAKATITFPSSSSTPISTESQSLPIVVVVEKGTQGQSGNNTMTATAATLASKITDIVLSGSTTPKLGQSEIRKSAPMSSLNPSVSGNGDKPLSSRPSPKFSATPASHMNPTGAGGSSEGGTSKLQEFSLVVMLKGRLVSGGLDE